MSRYRGEPDFAHDTPPATGVLLTNLGTPDAPTPAALRRYLGEFLWDPRVVETPRPLWWLVLHGVILRIRPRRAAHAYQRIWTEEGSPLLAISKRQAAGMQAVLSERFGGPVKVALAMRYGTPSIAAGLETLRRANVRRLLVLPLYPQYSATTTASTFDAVADVLKTWRYLPELRMVTHYHDHPGYIRALGDSIAAYWRAHGRPQQLLFSFHGLPERYLRAGDPYYCQCHKTARLVAEALQLQESEWQLAFQSRFGREEWLKPYTDKTLEEWARTGTRQVDVVCPGFSADCLETLEEIALLNRDLFLAAGGERYRYIPCLNDAPAHLQMLGELVMQHCGDWPEAAPDYDARATAAALRDTQTRAVARGAPR